MRVRRMAILCSVFLFIGLVNLANANAGDSWVFNRLVRTDNIGKVGTYLASIFFDTGTVGGINATSTATFNIQAGAGLDPFTIASSSGANWLTFNKNGNFGIGTSTPQNALTVIGSISSSALTSGNCVQAGVGGLLATTNGACGGSTAKQLPTYIVAASGGDFTTIQAALTACGAGGGATIYLTDALYAQAGTGLTWRGSNCNIYGRNASTTITFTGATTLFKTNAPASGFANNGLHHLVITADGNAAGVAIDMSNMSHGIYEDIVIDSVATDVVLNDTQNITFYNIFRDFDFTTIAKTAINASSTNPVNANVFENGFIGCSANCTAIFMNQGNNNHFLNIRPEPASTTGTVGIRIIDTAAGNGVFDNTFENMYIEANGTGISIANTLGSNGGITRNKFIGGIIDANTVDFSASSTSATLQSFIGVDNNFGKVLTSLQAPVGIGTTTPIASLSIFGLNGLKPFAVASSTGLQLFTINQNGKVGIGTDTPAALLDVNNGNATTTVILDNSSATKGGCIKLKDADGAGYTYLSANNGVLTVSTGNCQ